MKRKINQLFRYLKRNPSEVFFGMLGFVFVGFILFFAYSKFFLTTYLQHSITGVEEEITQVQGDISAITGTAEYKKFAGGRYIQQTVAVKSWSDTISSLIKIFDELRRLSGGGLTLTDFKIDMDEIKMKGEVENLSYIYGDPNTLTGGIISKLENLNFIEYINIPFFNKSDNDSENLYKFNLDAKINNNATFTGTTTNTGTTSTATGSKNSSGK